MAPTGFVVPPARPRVGRPLVGFALLPSSGPQSVDRVKSLNDTEGVGLLLDHRNCFETILIKVDIHPGGDLPLPSVPRDRHPSAENSTQSGSADRGIGDQGMGDGLSMNFEGFALTNLGSRWRG